MTHAIAFLIVHHHYHQNSGGIHGWTVARLAVGAAFLSAIGVFFSKKDRKEPQPPKKPRWSATTKESTTFEDNPRGYKIKGYSSSEKTVTGKRATKRKYEQATGKKWEKPR